MPSFILFSVLARFWGSPKKGQNVEQNKKRNLQTYNTKETNRNYYKMHDIIISVIPCRYFRIRPKP
jgi:hypothetical protein